MKTLPSDNVTPQVVAQWIEDECTNGKTTVQIAKNFGITTRKAYAIASAAERAGLLSGCLIRLRDGSIVVRDEEAKKYGVGPIIWQSPETP
jgi:hypothetical protein